MARILVVDDRSTNRQLLATILRYGDHHILEAADGIEALGLLQDEPVEPVDLVITDIVMPNMSGFDFVAKLRADPKLANVPVIFYTATYRLSQIRSLADEYGVSIIIPKPSDPEQIINAVNSALGLNVSYPISPRTISSPEPYPEKLKVFIERISKDVIQIQTASLRLASIIELGMELLSERDIEKTLEIACRGVHDIIPSKYAALGILSNDSQRLQYFFTRGMSDEVKARLGIPVPRIRVFESMLTNLQPHRVRDLDGSPERLGLPASHPSIESFLGVPIFSPTTQTAYGWIYLTDKIGEKEFSYEDERLAMTLASQVGIIYEHLRMYDEIQQHSIQLQQEVNARRRAEELLKQRNEEISLMTQQLWQTSKLATMGELAASVAHELNNPLTTINLHLDLLLFQIPADDVNRENRAMLQVILQEAKRMGNLTQNLLQFSRRSLPQIATIDIGDEIEKTLELIHYHFRKLQITVIKEFASDVPMIRGDRQQLRQLFLNLFTNASDAMPQGGTLTIRVSRSSGHIIIEIVDTGVGISPENLPKIMNSFFTTKPEGKGTGLGLAICQRIVSEHRGTLTIESEVGRGTTGRIMLPFIK